MVHTQARKSFRMWGLQDLVGFLYADCKILEHNQLDITVIDKESKKCLLINPTWQFDSQIEKKEEKCTDHSELKYEIEKIRKWER